MYIKRCWLFLIIFTLISGPLFAQTTKDIISVSRDKLNKRTCIVVKGDVFEPPEQTEEAKRAKRNILEIFGGDEKKYRNTKKKPREPEHFALALNFLLPETFAIKGLEDLPEKSPRYVFMEDHEYPHVITTLHIKYFNPPSTEGIYLPARLIEVRQSIFDEYSFESLAVESCTEYLESISERNINVINTELRN